jgi:hypothetical protein
MAGFDLVLVDGKLHFYEDRRLRIHPRESFINEPLLAPWWNFSEERQSRMQDSRLVCKRY